MSESIHICNPQPSVSIIIPVRNEAGTIEKMVTEIPYLARQVEIIFIEGHSLDNTWDKIEEVVKEYKGDKTLRYTKQEGVGKGNAVRKGFDMARGDILIIYDGDMSVPADEIKLFYEALIENKFTLVNGSRFIYPMEKAAMKRLNYIANKIFSFTFKWLFKKNITDTLCGTKALWKDDYKKIEAERKFFGEFDPFGDFDLLFGAARLNFNIIDLPIHYKERVYGTTNISRWHHGWLLLKMTVFAVRKIKFHI